MQAVWNGDASTQTLIAEFRKYIVCPEKSDWMDEEVRTWALKHPDRIVKATSKGWLAEQAKEHGGEIRREAEKLIRDSKDVIAYFKQLLAMEQRD